MDFNMLFKQEEFEYNGNKFIVKEMNAKDAGEYEASLYKVIGNQVKYDTKLAKIKLLLFTLCDAEGKRLFGLNDMEKIGQFPSSFVDKVFQVASKLNALEKESPEKN